MGPIARRFPFVLALSLLLAGSGLTPGRAGSVSYAQMGPLTAYLMADRQAEIRLAQSAAPSALSIHATVLVLGRRGYETAEKGTNGFTCLVERAWMSPFDSPEFWNWKMRGPICYNPAASRTVLLYTLRRTENALSGLSKYQMLDRTQAAVAGKQLPVPDPASMAYMLSKHGNLGDGVGPWVPHLMIYAPKSDGANGGASWGADVPGSPVILNTSRRVMPEPETIFMLPVAHWSDGTAAR